MRNALVPVTGPRERKKVERYVVSVGEKAEKKLVIPEVSSLKNPGPAKQQGKISRPLHTWAYARVFFPRI